jgi:DNA-binding transcriptional regulator PaaX
MNIMRQALYTVSNYPGGYRVIYDLLYQRENRSRSRDQVLRNTLSKMKKHGLLSNEKGVWKITSEGKLLLKNEEFELTKFSKQKNKSTKLSKTTMVIFDIPEKKRLYRNWLRNELVGFGFELVQKSVWFGPALPKEFITYLGERKLLEYVRFFRVTEKDVS